MLCWVKKKCIPVVVKKKLKLLLKKTMSDTFWEEALQNIKAFSSPKSQYILVPHEFLSKINNSVPYGYSFFVVPESVDLVCIHKGLIDELSVKFIKKMLLSHDYVFGNAVFCVFVKRSAGNPQGRKKYLYDFDNWMEKRCITEDEIITKTSLNILQVSEIKNILIITANNFGNVGDDAITHAASNLMSQIFPLANVRVDNAPVKRRLIEKTDLLVLGGGGIYYDGDIKNAINYTNYIFYAQEAGVPCIGIGIGTQGIRTEIGKLLFKTALNGCRLTIVRDKNDKKVLTELGVTQPVEITQDIVFSLAPRKVIRKALSVSKTKKIGISLLDSSNLLAASNMKPYQKSIFSSVAHLAEFGYDIVYICQSLDDLELYQKLKSLYGGTIRKINFVEAKEGFKFYQDIDLCITSRFHGLIFSVISGTPVISVGTNGSKTDRLINHSIKSLKKIHIPIKEFSLETLKPLLKEWEHDPAKFVARQEEVSFCREEAFRTAQLVKSCVLGG